MAWPRLGWAVCTSGLLTFTTVTAQQPSATAPLVQTARQAAPVDLTGYWVAQVTEDWRFRMITPAKGDYAGVPLTAAGREAADRWSLTRDAANGALCRAYGAGGLMRLPTRVRVSWADDQTLKLETDAGQQTRLFRFGREAQPGRRSLQGHSSAQWMPLPPPAPAQTAGVSPAPSAGSLKVVTTNLQPGYLRKNGVPYSENAMVTEYFDRLSIFGDDYLELVTVVTDAAYLDRPFITSTQFKRESDGSKWSPSPCTIDPPAGERQP